MAPLDIPPLFGKELDCASVVTAIHTHSICYVQDKMAFDLHPIIYTWDVVTIPVTVLFSLGVRLCSINN